MKTEKLGQESAFPVLRELSNGSFIMDHRGISKRLYLAGMAMQGILSANAKETWGNFEGAQVPEYVAKMSFDFADELLKQESL